MSRLTNVDVLLTSVLANFICDACTGDDLSASAHREITDHVEALHRYSLSHPSTGIVVAPPLPRSEPNWFSAYLPGFSAFLYHEVTRMGNPMLKFMTPFVAPPSYFEADGVHLNAEAGVTFIQFLITNCDLLHPSPMQEVAPIAPPSEIAVLTQSVDLLRSDVVRRRLQDNLIFARIKEDRDHEINRSREDRCTISGLAVRTAPPQEPKERKDFFKGLISDLVSLACPEADPAPLVLDVIVNMRSGRGPPYFEVKMDSVASSVAFRTSAARLAKAGTGPFSGLFISNTVNPSTRIRIDIMKLIAKRLTTTREVAYVQGFSSRPTLHYRVVEGPPEPNAPAPAFGTGRSYTFTESVERWGDLLSQGSLEPVRRKALQSFRGCLEQYFVVLSDFQDPEEVDIISKIVSGRGRPGYSRRPRYAGRRGSNFTRLGSSQSRTTPAPGSSGASSIFSLKRPLDVGTETETIGTPTKKQAEDQ